MHVLVAMTICLYPDRPIQNFLQRLGFLEDAAPVGVSHRPAVKPVHDCVA